MRQRADGTLGLLVTALRESAVHFGDLLTLARTEIDGNLRAIVSLVDRGDGCRQCLCLGSRCITWTPPIYLVALTILMTGTNSTMESPRRSTLTAANSLLLLIDQTMFTHFSISNASGSIIS